MKVLVIDYITYFGHRNFNKIHVEAFSDTGCTIELVGRESAIELIEDLSCISKSFLPKWTLKKYPLSFISERVKNIVSLLWIKRKYDLSDFDLIIFLAYDILSISLFRVRNKVLLINHNNVSQLSNSFKRLLTRQLPLHYGHVVLTKDSEEYLKGLMIKNVYYVPHGYVETPKNVKKTPYLKSGQRFLFIPVNRWYNSKIIAEIICSEKVKAILAEADIIILLKKKLYDGVAERNFIFLDNNIPDEEYNYLMSKALSVVLPYSEDFQYRSSGILFESVASNIPIISTGISSMLQYKDMLSIFFFTNAEEFGDCVRIISMSRFEKKDTRFLKPVQYWQNIIEKY